MSTLDVYNLVRNPPEEAKKPIKGGRLGGMTDINPMWRIKKLTEIFGLCGIGWKYEIVKQWIEEGANGEKAAFCNINLYVNFEGKWSEAIPGTGGSSFIAKERNGMYTSDECFKMALTDAISVSCKAIGMAADVYWQSDRTKYDTVDTPKPPQETSINCPLCGDEIRPLKKDNGEIASPESILNGCGGMCYKCYLNAKKYNQQNLGR